MSYSFSISAKKSRSQSMIATHVFVPGICPSRQRIDGVRLKLKEGVAAHEIDLVGTRPLNFCGVVMKSRGSNVGTLKGDGNLAWKYPPMLHRGTRPDGSTRRSRPSQ